jgi:uncharacterized protein YggT (Ycf19 family)
VHTVLYVIARCVQLLLGFVEVAMFARAILSWFIYDEENRLMLFLVAVTEPFIYPIRVLCSHIKALDNMMLDIPFFITFLLISIVNGLLPVVTL